MTLDDLGRAAYEAACDAQTQDPGCIWVAWESLDSDDKRVNGLSALAAVERFAEEAIRELQAEADSYEEATLEDGLDRKALRDYERLRQGAIDAAVKLEELLASLRAEVKP